MANFKKVALSMGALAMLLPAITFAHGINLNSNRKFNMPAAIGTVISVSGNSISLNGKDGVTYTVNAANAKITKFAEGSKTAITASEIINGDTLVVLGTKEGTNITATQIVDGRVGKAVLGKMNRPIMGTVASINGNTLTVTGKNSTIYTVDASNATIVKFANNTKTTISVSNIAVNETVLAAGTLSGNNLVATHIIDGSLPLKHLVRGRHKK